MNFLKQLLQRFNQTSIEKVSITDTALHSDETSLHTAQTKLFQRVSEQFLTRQSIHKIFHFAIIDLETLGPDPKVDPIIELGILKGAFTSNDGIIQIMDSYQNNSHLPLDTSTPIDNLSERMMQTFNQQAIDWEKVFELINNCDLIICYNSKLKRSFLENQTPENIQTKCKDLPFGCLLKDIDWTKKPFEANTLKLLNYELGYFYDADKILTRCWAALNCLINVNDAFNELINNIKKRTVVLCLDPKLLDRTSLLKLRKYTYSDGSKRFPQCWWISITEEDLGHEIAFLENVVFERKGIAEKLSCYLIPAKMKHSSRFKETVLYPQFIENKWVLCENTESFA